MAGSARVFVCSIDLDSPASAYNLVSAYNPTKIGIEVNDIIIHVNGLDYKKVGALGLLDKLRRTEKADIIFLRYFPAVSSSEFIGSSVLATTTQSQRVTQHLRGRWR